MIFFSADVVGSTRFKNQHPITKSQKEAWPIIFNNFYNNFAKELYRCLDSYEKIEHHQIHCPSLWKINGDEILLKDIIYSESQVNSQTIAFYETVVKMDNELNKHDLGVKGCVWSAGFPIRNKEVYLHYASKYGEKVGQIQEWERPDMDTGFTQYVPEKIISDYIGVEIDSGFRLCVFTSKRQVAVSLDIADFLTRMNYNSQLRIHHVGWRILKGSYNDIPYPIFWLSRSDKINKVYPWDGYDDELKENYINKPYMHSDEVQKFITEYRNTPDLSRLLIFPYIFASDKPSEHEEIWRQTPELTEKIFVEEVKDDKN